MAWASVKDRMGRTVSVYALTGLALISRQDKLISES